MFVEDQVAPVDPLAAIELDRFERLRDPSHTRTLPDIDLRHLFEANNLVLVTSRWHARRAASLFRAALRGTGAPLAIAPADDSGPLAARARELLCWTLVPVLTPLAARRLR